MEIWIFFYSSVEGAVDLNNSPFIDEMEERVLITRFIFAAFCIFLWLSLVWTSTFEIKEKKEEKSVELLKRRCLCTLQYLGTGYNPASVFPLTLFLCHNCHRYLWPREVPSEGQEALLGLLFKVENSQSVLPLVAHHQQYYKAGEWDTEFLLFGTEHVAPTLFYRRFLEGFLLIMEVENCKDFYVLFWCLTFKTINNS